MSGISDFISKAKTAAETVGSKAGELAESTKICIEISSIENEIEKLYAFIGEAYYNSIVTEQTMISCEEAVSLIKEKLGKISNLKAKLVDLKKIRICPVCQTESETDAMYCKKCGSKF